MTLAVDRPAGARSIDELLAEARSRLVRIFPEQAAARVSRGALLVDIRPAAQRAVEGEVPGSLIVERNVLEWRVDPASGHADPTLCADFGRRLILVCDEGYQSSLAAATLKDLGFERATDLVGGFQAWRAEGLPVQPPES